MHISTECAHLSMEASHTVFALRFLSHHANIQRSQSIDNDNVNFIVKYHKIFGNTIKLFIIGLVVTGIQALIYVLAVITFGFPFNYDKFITVSNWTCRFWIVRLFITFYCFIKQNILNIIG